MSFLPQDILKPVMQWLLKQRTETVILMVILVVMVVTLTRGIPWATGKVEGHISKINRAHAQNIERVSSSFDKASERDSEIIRSLLRSHGIDEDVPLNSKNLASGAAPRLVPDKKQK